MEILCSSGGWEVQEQGVADLVLGESSLSGSEMAIFSLCLHIVEGWGEVSLMRTLIPFMKAPPLNTITLCSRLQHKDFAGTQTFSP